MRPVLSSFTVSKEDTSVFKRDELVAQVPENHWPASCSRSAMKVAAKQNHKALDYFSSTIIPCQALQAVVVLTIKHAVLLVGFGIVMMALVRLILAD